MGRTKGTCLPEQRAKEILSAHIPMAVCKPTCLLKLKVTNNGLTSQWSVLNKYKALLQEILEETDGRVPNQKNLQKQFDAFLKDHEMKWCLADVIAPMYNLRSMTRSLLDKKRSRTRLPIQYQSLQPLVDMMHTSDTDEDDVGSGGDDAAIEVPVVRPIVPNITINESESESMDVEEYIVKKPPNIETPKKPPNIETFDDPLSALEAMMFPTPGPKKQSEVAASPVEALAKLPKPIKIQSMSEQLVPIKGPSVDSFMGLLTSTQLAAIGVDDSIVGPTPEEYRTKNSKPEEKTMAPKNRLRKKTHPDIALRHCITKGKKDDKKKGCSKTAKKTPCSDDVVPPCSDGVAPPCSDSVLEPYMVIAGVDKKVLLNRVHCKGYDTELRRLTGLGIDVNKAQRAGIAGRKLKERFMQLKGWA